MISKINQHELINKESEKKDCVFGKIKESIYETFVKDFIENNLAGVSKYKLVGLKKTGKTIQRKNGENTFVDVEMMPKGRYRFTVSGYGKDIIFQGKDLDNVQDQYDRRYENGKTYDEYEAPDGTTGTYAFFLKEAKKGYMHGLEIKLNKQKKRKHLKKS